MTTQPITERVMQEARLIWPRFSVMDILFAINRKRRGPMVDLQQVKHACDALAKAGNFTKISGGRYEWGK